MRTDQMRSDKLRPGKMRTDNSKQTKFTFWGRPAPLSLVVFLSFLSVNAGALTLSIQERYHHLWTDLLHIAVFLKTSFDDCCSDHHPLSFLIINWLFPKLRMAFMQLAALLNWLLFSCFCICICHSTNMKKTQQRNLSVFSSPIGRSPIVVSSSSPLIGRRLYCLRHISTTLLIWGWISWFNQI